MFLDLFYEVTLICFISLNISFYLGWNTFFISRLLLQISTVICWMCYIRSNIGLIVILLLLPLKQWLHETIYIKLFIFITSKLHNTWGVLHLSKRFICWCDTKTWYLFLIPLGSHLAILIGCMIFLSPF